VDNIQDRLLGCHANKLSIAGRIVILNLVLSAILVYFMSMFLLPNWMIKKIDKVIRNFL
jgi:antibiotic biosynthesis monooxygenase (ABM) superfamily enzyme